jgi:hypothetical protein
MTRRRSRRNEELRHRVFLFVLKLLSVAAVFAVTAYYAYEVGFRVARGEAEASTENLRKAEEQIKVERDSAAADRSALADAQRELADLKTRYDQVKPSDELRQLLDLMRSKMAAGVTQRRLALVIRSAEMPHDCRVLPSRRLLVRTPQTRGMPPGLQIKVDDLITVSANGAAGNGGREAWFDPAAAVSVHITPDGSQNADVNGALPLEYSLMARDGEYHLSVSAASSRGWIEVAAERCALR